MACDFVHTEELVDAVIAVLTGADGALHTGGLPASWFEEGTGHEPDLILLEHGDLADVVSVQALLELSPSILVRGLGPEPTGGGGAGGVQETEELIRVVHFRAQDDCYDAAGAATTDYTRARARYAKVISAALFHDRHRRLATIAADETRTDVELTCADGAGAQIVDATWAGWDLGWDIGNPRSTDDVAQLRQLGMRAWTIACDIRVRIRSGGQA